MGKQSEFVTVGGATTVGALVDKLVSTYPRLSPMRSSIRLSVNQEIVGSGSPINDGDEVGVLPPVAGG